MVSTSVILLLSFSYPKFPVLWSCILTDASLSCGWHACFIFIYLHVMVNVATPSSAFSSANHTTTHKLFSCIGGHGFHPLAKLHCRCLISCIALHALPLNARLFSMETNVRSAMMFFSHNLARLKCHKFVTNKAQMFATFGFGWLLLLGVPLILREY